MKEYSGKFVVRLEPKLHKRLSQEAKLRAVSINSLCAQLIGTGLERRDEAPWWSDDAERIVSVSRKKFGGRLVGVLIFGSYAQGTATDASDLDVLLVMDGAEPIRRSLYTWWDEKILPLVDARINPQFVSLPQAPENSGGIWFEVALASQIIWERGRAISRLIGLLNSYISADKMRRYWEHGQPYWVRT